MSGSSPGVKGTWPKEYGIGFIYGTGTPETRPRGTKGHRKRAAYVRGVPGELVQAVQEMITEVEWMAVATPSNAKGSTHDMGMLGRQLEELILAGGVSYRRMSILLDFPREVLQRSLVPRIYAAVMAYEQKYMG
ncbi:MAG: hypothetical protein ABH879_10685 [archaeon]